MATKQPDDTPAGISGSTGSAASATGRDGRRRQRAAATVRRPAAASRAADAGTAATTTRSIVGTSAAARPTAGTARWWSAVATRSGSRSGTTAAAAPGWRAGRNAAERGSAVQTVAYICVSCAGVARRHSAAARCVSSATAALGPALTRECREGIAGPRIEWC